MKRPLSGNMLTGVILTCAALLLSACENTSLPFLEKPLVLQCPDYYVLEDAATITQFRDGPGRDIIDVVARGQIGEIQLGCVTDVDRETDSGKMLIDITPIIAAEMGPANSTQSTVLPYFVVVTDPKKNILYREPLKVDVSFQGNKTQVILLPQTTTVEIPITPEIRNHYYRIYAGFELTEEQAAYNRKAIQDRLR